MSNVAIDQPQSEFYIVEVIGHDGIAHHLGPFRRRADAEGWIAQNAQTDSPGVPTLVDVFANLAKPRLSLV